MAQKIRIRRGLQKDLPALDNGEIVYTTDTKRLFVGNGTAEPTEFNSSQEILDTVTVALDEASLELQEVVSTVIPQSNNNILAKIDELRESTNEMMLSYEEAITQLEQKVDSNAIKSLNLVNYKSLETKLKQLDKAIKKELSKSIDAKSDAGHKHEEYLLKKTFEDFKKNVSVIGDNLVELQKDLLKAKDSSEVEYALLNHRHRIADIQGLMGVLASKEDSFEKGNIVAGTNVTISGTLTNRLVGSGNITISATGGGSGGGDMFASVYDPQNIADDAFDRANHTGVQPTSSISGLDELIIAYAVAL